MRRVTCSLCEGSGQVNYRRKENCPKCNGVGSVKREEPSHYISGAYGAAMPIWSKDE